MNTSAAPAPPDPSLTLGVTNRCTAGAALVFLAVRIPLLFVRQPFFDELFTQWITAKSFGGILHALMSDSGPPLYYFVIHALEIHSVALARLMSLVCAGLAFRFLMRRHGAAAFLYAVFPPAVLFAVDARSYAMCAMFVTMGVLALDRDDYDVAAVSFIAAAYSHYYGFFFFPLLIVRWRALAAALVAFAPGLWLALHQPAEATAWIRPAWPDALFVRPPLALIAVLIAAAVIHWNRFTVMAAVPVACVIVLAIAGRPVYLPLRFESVIAPPLVLAIATSRLKWGAPLKAAFIAASLFICALGIIDHANRPPDDYRAAAIVASQLRGRLVASGYLYLETIVLRPDAIAFPPEQAVHPGWRAQPQPGSNPPPAPFYWVGERAAPELQILRRTRRVQPVYVNARALVARVM